MATIQGNKYLWEYVIGLEIHAQVKSESKLFSSAPNEFGAAPNTHVSLIDAAFPGMLPVLNEYCVEQAIKTGLSLNGKVMKRSVFDRKNYFYADLPAGYQISQFYHPIIVGGHIDIIDENDKPKTLRIHHIHLEQDAGKSIHDQSPHSSYIDLNRAGVALMEIVSEPDMRSPYDAAEYVKKLRSILRYIGACDGDMEKGSLRCDANVSVRRAGEPLGTRCEIKNINSIKNIVAAIEYEARRQIDILEDGGEIRQETRLFDADRLETRTMRSKEDAEDYRYFPDPDLLPLELSDDYIEKIKKALPELPDAKHARYIINYGLSDYDASVLVADKSVSEYFELLVEATNDPKISANWITGDLFAYLNEQSIEITESKITHQHLAELILLIKDGTISGKIAKQIFEIMQTNPKMPSILIEEEGLRQVSDSSEIEKIIEKVLAENQPSVDEYKSGKDKLFGFFVGQVMKHSGGKANPALVNELLKRALS